MAMKQILVGVDGSPESKLAARKAAEIAALDKSLVRLVCVVPPIQVYTNVVASPAQTKAQQAEAKAIVDDVAKELTGVQVETQVVDGIPSHVLAQLSTEPEVDMIVVGHRGVGKLTRLLIGSVASKLVQLSAKPVLVVR